jgi:4-hydroxybenzoyl-CoA thioesterase
MADFVAKKLVRMQHCDMAGIVFTPQYFNLFTEVLEDWWKDGIGISFDEMITNHRRAIPLRKAEAEFLKPSRLGDELEFSLSVSKISRATMDILIEASKENTVRCFVKLMMVQVNVDDFQIIEWSDDWLKRFREYKK